MDVLPGFLYDASDGFNALPKEVQQLILGTARKHMGKEQKIMVFDPSAAEVHIDDEGRVVIPIPDVAVRHKEVKEPIIAMLDDFGSIEALREESTFPTINTQYRVRFSLESEKQ